jgi:hypothetical protein
MKLICSLFTALLIPNLCLSQKGFSETFAYEFEQPYPESAGQLTQMGKNLVGLKIDKSGLVLTLFDEDNAHPVKTQRYDEYDESTSVNYLNLKERHYLILRTWDKKAKKYDVICREVNSDGTLLTKETHLMSIPSGYIEISKSNDDSKVLIHYRTNPVLKKDIKNYSWIMHSHVFDLNFEKLWSKDFKIPYDGIRASDRDWAVANNGHAYFLIEVKREDHNKTFRTKTGKPFVWSELYLISPDTVPMKMDIGMDDEYFCNGRLVALSDGFAFAGISKSMLDLREHFFIRKFNSKNELYFDTTYQLIETMKDFGVNWFDEKYKSGWTYNPFSLERIVEQKDGSLVFFADRFDRMSFNTHSSTSSATVYYGNGLMLKIDSVGNLSWIQVLPRNRSEEGSFNNGYSEQKPARQFRYLTQTSSHLVFFIDEYDNSKTMNHFGVVPMGSVIEGIFSVYVIDDETGKLEKHRIFDLSTNKHDGILSYYATNIIESSTGSFMVEMKTNNKNYARLRVWNE